MSNPLPTIQEQIEEKWATISEFNNYEISNNGLIRNKTSGFIRKLVDTKDGYLSIHLKSGKLNKTFTIHRLVAKYFIANPDNLPCVNHKDLNKRNNCFLNLEWCTHLQNMQHAAKNKQWAFGTVSAHHKLRISQTQGKKVIAYNPALSTFTIYDSQRGCAKQMGINSNRIWYSLKFKTKFNGDVLIFNEADWEAYRKTNNIK